MITRNSSRVIYHTLFLLCSVSREGELGNLCCFSCTTAWCTVTRW